MVVALAGRAARIYADYAALNTTPGLTPGLPLGLPQDAKTVQVDSGATLAGDGPYVGANGAVGGYFVVEADDLDAAIDVAARVPAAAPRWRDRGPARRHLLVTRGVLQLAVIAGSGHWFMAARTASSCSEGTSVTCTTE